MDVLFHPHRCLSLIVSLLLVFTFGCSEKKKDAAVCAQAVDSFDLYLSGPQKLIDSVCAPCHQNNKSSMRLYPGNHEHNTATLLERSRLEVEGVPLPLIKMTGGEKHGGGQVTTSDSKEYEAFADWIDMGMSKADGVTNTNCTTDESHRELWSRLVLLSDTQTVHRAYQQIAGVHAKKALLEKVGSGKQSLRSALLAMLKESSVEAWVKELEDADNLHTRKYWGYSDFLSGDRYPSKNFWETEGFSEQEKYAWQTCAEQAIGQEAVNTIWQFFKSGRPYTQLACTSIAVNPCSARSYGMDLSIFKDPRDFNEFVMLNPPDVPNSGGILASNVFAARWPTTPTNRSRNRSRYWYSRTLNIDILARGTRPVDVNAVAAFNPVMNEDGCTKCHEDVDPVAQMFDMSWDNMGIAVIEDNETHADMFAPGIGQDHPLPFSERAQALSWAGKLVCTDPDLRMQFRTAAIRRYFTAITGVTIHARPTDPEQPFFESLTQGVKQQERFLSSLREIMEKKQDDIREVVVEILLSPWFRTSTVSGDVTHEESAQLSVLGRPCTITPHALNRVVESLGFNWMNENGSPYLTSADHFLFYTGGSDSDQVLTPLCDTNGFRALVEDRLGHEFACRMTSADFEQEPDKRVFFPLVSPDDSPTYKGELIPGIIERIQANLQHLSDLFASRVLTPEELSDWTDFAISTQAACLKAMTDETWSENIPSPCQTENIRTDPLCVLTMWRTVLDVMITEPENTYGLK